MALDSHRVQVRNGTVSAYWVHDRDSPEKYSTSVSYSTARRRLLPVDGGMHLVGIQITTRHSIPSLQQYYSVQPRHPISQDSSHNNLVSDWHHDGVLGVLSGGFSGLNDLAHQLVLTIWMTNEESNLAMPLEAVDVAVQTDFPLELNQSRPAPRGQIAMKLTWLEFEQAKRSVFMKPRTSNEHTAFLALGSNVDDRMALIESACKSMETRGIEIVRTSALYETAPMYYENQQPFINGVCQVRHFLQAYW